MLHTTTLTVSGNVTREPELRYRKVDGQPFTVVAIACNGRRYDAQEGRFVVSGVTYYDIICKGSLGANVLKTLHTGMPIVAHGKFRMHEWETDTMRGARPCVGADSVGVDLTWGTASYQRGSASYPDPERLDLPAPPPEEGGPAREDSAPNPEDAGADLEDDGADLDDDGADLDEAGLGHDDLPDGVDANGELTDEAAQRLLGQPA
ncbi:single-stranded DNA-binding protein [Ornithinimicrobium sp. Y1694]|uniref:single-stranded DNA-binding protein n=1 Tax=Ornithinimicrobium sp. Y1694 TaxID=3418590 RepID=UPI003CF7A43E